MTAPRWVWLPATIIDDAGRLHTVDGYVSDAAPGLIVTRALVPHDTPMGAPQDGWSVTHRASGCRVSSWPDRAAAQAEAVRVAAVLPGLWTQERAVVAAALNGSPIAADAVRAGETGRVGR